MYIFSLHVYLMLPLQAEALYVPAWINLIKSRIKRIKLTQFKNQIKKKARYDFKKLPDTVQRKGSIEFYCQSILQSLSKCALCLFSYLFNAHFDKLCKAQPILFCKVIQINQSYAKVLRKGFV